MLVTLVIAFENNDDEVTPKPVYLDSTQKYALYVRFTTKKKKPSFVWVYRTTGDCILPADGVALPLSQWREATAEEAKEWDLADQLEYYPAKGT